MSVPMLEHALAWFRQGEVTPDKAVQQHLANPAADDLAKRLRVDLATPQGERILQFLLERTIFRAPVDHRMAGAEYRQHAQLRQGQNQVAAMFLAYIDHAEKLEKDHERRSPDAGLPALRSTEPGPDADAAGGSDDDPWWGWSGSDGSAAVR